MRGPDEKNLTLEALTACLEEAYRAYLPRIPSRTLRRAMEVQIGRQGEGDDLGEDDGALYIPHYWATYLHDGRGPVHRKTAPYIIYFADIRDDPRVDGGRNYPVRASQIKKLTPSQYRAGLAKNRRNAELGLPPHMYVLKDHRGRPRPAGPAEGTRWFERKQGVAAKVNPRARRALFRYFTNTVDPLMEKDSATGRF